MRIYLASKSPRRKELLELMEISFEILLVDIPEIVKPNETPENYSKRIVVEKLHASWNKIQNENLKNLPILCADTEVVWNDIILGKPRDEEDAFNMLSQYSGQTHQVITTVGVIYKDFEQIRTNTTNVTFTKMNKEDIRHYLSSGNYKDKSGSYGIQSYIGQFISHIEGCFYSVMGLPLNTVREILIELNNYKEHESSF